MFVPGRLPSRSGLRPVDMMLRSVDGTAIRSAVVVDAVVVSVVVVGGRAGFDGPRQLLSRTGDAAGPGEDRGQQQHGESGAEPHVTVTVPSMSGWIKHTYS